MNGIVPTLVFVAHDATCKKGDEVMFHGMAVDKEDSKDESDPITKDEIEDAKTSCTVSCIMLLVGIGFGIYYLIMHLFR